MRIHYLEHVPFEKLGNIEKWAGQKKYSVTKTALYLDDGLPPVEAFDWLIVMGGPMNIYEEGKYPWLAREKKFIAEAIAEGKVVLGICLGAQLIADVLGSGVYKNEFKEIGWFPIQLTEKAGSIPLLKGLPPVFKAFHWHGDTFSLPEGCTNIAESAGCKNQGFIYKDRVIGLQFHLESTLQGIQDLIANCGEELVEGRFIQQAGEILSQVHYLDEMETILYRLLDNINESYQEKQGR
ncbi:amidotransferase [Thermanaerosceptrum fracticalcis]|uniref:Amidotransferase n=1 Tax=Thermanaerosceptrum fracticalcis TaxID=1712410 RepID=A0A7G6E2R0_THEFR|nr:type 1 glutamine amidotransferase [Thermanaerosceptrum fracticalcis]QNB46364.1 amidotransferase [Thermanaerosceptrum fracticalcis]